MGYYPPGSNEDWLYMHCPVSRENCPKKDVTSPSYWYHKDCGGQLKIGLDLDITCASCGTYDNWKNWKFKCRNHPLYKEISNNLDFYDSLGNLLSIRYTNSEKRMLVSQIMAKVLNDHVNR